MATWIAVLRCLNLFDAVSGRDYIILYNYIIMSLII